MTSFGQYPLVYQVRQLGDGSFVPVGLAEVSAFQSLSAVTLVVSSISATNYQGLDLGALSFTGVQTLTVTGAGSSLLVTDDPYNPVLKGLIFETNGFLTPSVPSPGDPDLTITYGLTPLSYAHGGTNNTDTPDQETVAYWDADRKLRTNTNFTFDELSLSIPPGGVYKVDGSQITLSNLAGVTSPVTLNAIPAATVATTYLQHTGGGNYIWTGVAGGTGGISIPATPGRILISVDATSTTSDPQFTYDQGSDTLNTYSINNVCDVCAVRFSEGGQLLSTKYFDRASTGVFETTSYSRSNFAPITLLDSYTLTSTYVQFTGTLKDLAYKTQINLQTTSVTGTLPVVNGGLGFTSIEVNKILVGGAANTVTTITTPSTGYLRWTGTTFSWESPTGTVALPTDPCAVVFLNTTGNALVSNPAIRINNSVSTVLIESNAANGTGGIDLSPGDTTEGFIRWDHDYDTLGVQGVGDVQIALGVDDLIPIQNSTGVTIKKGQVFYVSSADTAGFHGKVAAHNNSISNDVAFRIGICLKDVTNGNYGYLIKKGLVRNATNTDFIISADTGSLVVGDKLYVSDQSGKLTRTPPAAGLNGARVGIVLKKASSNITVGVDVETHLKTSDLYDVQSQPTNDGQILVWNNTGNYYTTGTINDITGTLAVTKGGTGKTSFTADQLIYGTNFSQSSDLTFNGTILKSPAVCGTTVCATTFNEGGQTLSTKYYDRNSTGVFALTAVLRDLAYVTQVDLQTTSVTGTLQVSKGGTGLTTLTAGNLLVGNGTTVSLQPTATFETTGYSRANFATIASLASYTPTSTYVAFTGTLKDLAYATQVDLQTTSVTGTLQVSKGGTSKTSFNSNELIYGSFLQNSNLTFDGTVLKSTVVCGTTVCATAFTEGGQTLSTKYYDRASTGIFETTSNAQNTYLAKTTFNAWSGALALSAGLKDVDLTSTPPTSNQVLKWNAASQRWKAADDSTGVGGGTPGGSNTHVQVNFESNFSGNAGLTYNLDTSTLRAQFYSNLPSASPFWNANQLSGYPIVSGFATTGGPLNDQILKYFTNAGTGGAAPINGWYWTDLPTNNTIAGYSVTAGAPITANLLFYDYPVVGANVWQYYGAIDFANVNIFNASKLQNTAISTASPSINDVLSYNGTNWAPSGNLTLNSVSATNYYNVGPSILGLTNAITNGLFF